jgi:DNA modification methylase
MELNKIYAEDCLVTMGRMSDDVIDVVLTSPPYNMTSRKGGYADKEKRYDVYVDWKTEQEYLDWTVNIFNHIDRVLKPNGVILYNFSYSIENPQLPYTLMSSLIQNTCFTIADTIVWKKTNSIPHPASYNRLNRIVEFIFVIVRKDEVKTFNCFKDVVKTSPKGQKYYEVVDNFILAKNNDKSTKINKATYSTDLCEQLLKVYSKEGLVVFDPFIGTGTTAVACKNLGMFYVGSEISEEQVKYCFDRLK